MPARLERRPARRVAAMVLAVVALHLALVGLLTRRAPPRPGPSRAAVVLRIVPAAPVLRSDPATRAELPWPSTATATRPRRVEHRAPAAGSDAPARDEPAVATVPEAITVSSPASPTLPTPPAPTASQPPLRLDLPAPSRATAAARNPALDDPRANAPPAGFGDRLARALGSDPRRVETSRGDGRLRVREGASCVDVQVARNAQLDPMEQSFRPTPKLAEPCR